MTQKQRIKERREYFRDRYAKQKKEGVLPSDRYDKKKRRLYNKWYRLGKPGTFKEYYESNK